MIQLISLALFLFSFQTMLPMALPDDDFEQACQSDGESDGSIGSASSMSVSTASSAILPPTSSNSTPVDSPSNTQIILYNPDESWVARLARDAAWNTTRKLRYALSMDDWKILFGDPNEKEMSEKIVLEYIEKNGSLDSKKLAQFERRVNRATRVAATLNAKLSDFIASYRDSENKALFLADNNSTWREILVIDKDHARVLVTEYTKNILPPLTLNSLATNYNTIEEIVTALNAIE